MLDIQIISMALGISTVFGILGFLAYLYFSQHSQQRIERSVRQIVEGESLFNAEQVLEILKQFSDDNSRLAALEKLTKHDTGKAVAFLKKVKETVDINKLNQSSINYRRYISLLSVVFFIILAVLALADKNNSPNNNGKKEPVKPLYNNNKAEIKNVPLDDKIIIKISPDELHSIVKVLENEKVGFSQVEKNETAAKAQKLAEESNFKDNDAPALILKSIANQQFDITGQIFEKIPATNKDIEEILFIGKGYSLYYQGLYEKAALSFTSSLQLNPDNPLLLSNTDKIVENLGDSLSVADILDKLADIHNYEKSIPLYERSEKIKEKTLGLEHSDTINSLNKLAEYHISEKSYTKAEPLLKKVLKAKKKALGEKHPDTAKTLDDLAMLYIKQNQYTKAKSLLEKSLDILKETVGENATETQTVQSHLTDLQSLQSIEGS